MTVKALGAVMGLAALAAAVAVVAYAWFVPIDLTSTVPVTIAKGEGTAQIATKLDQLGLLRARRLFIWRARWRGIDRHLRPGRYEFFGPTRMSDILDALSQGRAVQVAVTIPEGWTMARMAAHLGKQLGFDSAAFLAAAEDSAIAGQSGSPVNRIEGYLWPETYEFYWGVEPREVIARMLVTGTVIYVDSLGTRAASLGMSHHQVLTLASMIEAEAAEGDERARISAVFHNRLKRGMLLQCDPTVVYAIGGLRNGRPLQDSDLTVDSPYNTYLYPGLPPGPICSPGLAAIIAALYPDSTDDLYFVADGRGGHIFSSTLEEHNRAKVRVKNRRDR
ncbi:MAG: endolytic transglycosylase MltG [Candidatus Zixiibacteriota bacterium]